jgi:translation initiation factor 1
MKKRQNIVYSTDENFFQDKDESKEIINLAVNEQNLKIILKRLPGSRILTIIDGLKGDALSFNSLSKDLKNACGVGGSVKNMQILIQGNHREKIMKILSERGFKVKASGG